MSASLPPPVSPSVEKKDEEVVDLVDLVDRSLAGDAAAWRELWEELAPLIGEVTARRRWMGPLSRSQDDRDDVVVRVMGKLAAGNFAALRHFRDPQNGYPAESFPGWIASVAVRASIGHVRAHPDYVGRSVAHRGTRWITPDALSPEIEEIAGESPDLDAIVDAHRLAEQVGPHLRETQRAALGAWLEDTDHEAIAGEIGLADRAEAKREVQSAVKRFRDQRAADAAREENRPVGVADRPLLASSIYRGARRRRSPPGPGTGRNPRRERKDP